MDPVTAAILMASVTAGIQMYQSQEQANAQAAAQKEAEDKAVQNQNALVEEGFQKRRKAMGLGDVTEKTGLIASQSGGILTSVTDGNQASGL